MILPKKKKKSQVFIEFHLIGLDYLKMFECKKKVKFSGETSLLCSIINRIYT